MTTSCWTTKLPNLHLETVQTGLSTEPIATHAGDRAQKNGFTKTGPNGEQTSIEVYT